MKAKFLAGFLVAIAAAGCVQAQGNEPAPADNLMCFAVAALKISYEEDPGGFGLGEMTYFLGRLDAASAPSVTPKDMRTRLRKMTAADMKIEIEKCRMVYVNRFERMFELSGEVERFKAQKLKGVSTDYLFEGQIIK